MVQQKDEAGAPPQQAKRKRTPLDVVARLSLIVTPCVAIAIFAVISVKRNLTSDEALHRCVETGNVERLKSGLSLRRDGDAERQALLNELLLSAVEQGQAEVVAALVNEGADAKAGKSKALFLAITSKRSLSAEARKKVVQALLAGGADVNVERQMGTPLYMAVERNMPEVVHALVEGGANVDAVVGNRTPLVEAIKRGHADVVVVLLESCKNVNAAADGGEPPLATAIESENAEIVGLLVEAGANVNGRYRAPGLGNVMPLQHACTLGKEDVIAALIDAGANVNAAARRGWPPLVLAARNGNKSVVEKLLAAKASVKGEAGNLALRQALVSSEESGGQIAELLLGAGAEPATSHLCLAAEYGHAEVVKVLLAKGLDVNAKWQDSTALHAAALAGRAEAARLLLEAGADLNAKDKKGKTPLDLAKAKDHTAVADLLMKKQPGDAE